MPGHFRKTILTLLVGSLLTGLMMGCVATPPTSGRVSHDPLLGNVLLMVDVFVRQDVLGGGDYFVIQEAEAGAQAALGALQNYIAASAITVRTQITSVCAARLNATNATLRVADKIGGEVRDALPPLKFSPSPQDTNYENALSVVSTYAFERAAVTKKASQQQTTDQPPAQISSEEFRLAAGVIEERTKASSVLFLGVMGTRKSSAKTAVEVASKIAVGVGTAFLTAGLGTGFFLFYMPGTQMDGIIMEGALVDLKSGTLTWSNAVRTRGDPAYPEAMTNSQALDLLFHEIMFKSVDNPTAEAENQSHLHHEP